MEFKILPNTPIEELCRQGIMPRWMANDCLNHGMDMAEYVLCEFDWSWDWDLGNGYDDTQKNMLVNVRRTIIQSFNEQGITGYSFAQHWLDPSYD